MLPINPQDPDPDCAPVTVKLLGVPGHDEPAHDPIHMMIHSALYDHTGNVAPANREYSVADVENEPLRTGLPAIAPL